MYRILNVRVYVDIRLNRDIIDFGLCLYRYFINYGVDVGIVNSEGEVFFDFAEEFVMKDFFLE